MYSEFNTKDPNSFKVGDSFRGSTIVKIHPLSEKSIYVYTQEKGDLNCSLYVIYWDLKSSDFRGLRKGAVPLIK